MWQCLHLEGSSLVNLPFIVQRTTQLAYLHPEEESFGAGFKLQHINSSAGALVHPFELTVIREDDQVLNEDVKEGFNGNGDKERRVSHR